MTKPRRSSRGCALLSAEKDTPSRVTSLSEPSQGFGANSVSRGAFEIARIRFGSR